MCKFINIRQLLFLLLILTMIFIARQRQNSKPETQNKKIESTLLDPHRSLPAEYSPCFLCLMEMRQIDSGAVQDIVRYGQMRSEGDSLFFKGRSPAGKMLELRGILRADRILFTGMSGERADCPCSGNAIGRAAGAEE